MVILRQTDITIQVAIFRDYQPNDSQEHKELESARKIKCKQEVERNCQSDWDALAVMSTWQLRRKKNENIKQQKLAIETLNTIDNQKIN